MNLLRRSYFVWLGALLLALAVTLDARQEPAPAPSATPAQDSATKAEKTSKKKFSHADDFLIRGTVFNEKALSFPDVELRFRKEGQKKYKWETYTNSRGEFAVRVPQGSNYEILVHAKGFGDQTKTIEAKGEANEGTVVFRMQPNSGEKK